MDLKQRGLLDSTIVLWTGEFGRLPVSQGTDGRDHNRHGFSLWLAGGGFKRGLRPRRDRRVRLQVRRGRRDASTTSTRPCCTPSASTTAG